MKNTSRMDQEQQYACMAVCRGSAEVSTHLVSTILLQLAHRGDGLGGPSPQGIDLVVCEHLL